MFRDSFSLPKKKSLIVPRGSAPASIEHPTVKPLGGVSLYDVFVVNFYVTSTFIFFFLFLRLVWPSYSGAKKVNHENEKALVFV